MIHYVSSLPLSSRHRVSGVRFHPSHPYLAVQSHDKSVEIFRIRTEEEVRKKQARRKKRDREKAKLQNKDVPEQTEAQDEPPELVSLFTPHLVVRASGKIRSFDFGVDDHRHKGAFQVRFRTCDLRPLFLNMIFSYLRLYPLTLWKYLLFHLQQKIKRNHLRLRSCSR